MFIDMTFRFEIPDDQFGELQPELADAANQHDVKTLMATVAIPRHDKRDFIAQGMLVGLKQSF